MGVLEQAIASLNEAVLDWRIRVVDAGRSVDAAVQLVVDAALRDDKTPLMNQPALRRYGQQLVSGAGLADVHSDEPIDGVVLYGDVNDFKAFNTRHGHDLADLALNAVGVQLLEIARACNGRAFRRSGDEFVLLVPAAAFDLAVDELGSRMGHLEADLDGKVDAVSLSFGAARTGEDLTLDLLLTRAEQACEIAKRQGPGVVVEWNAEAATQASVGFRRRCSGCRTSISLAVPPTAQRPDGYRCPVCGEVLPP